MKRKHILSHIFIWISVAVAIFPIVFVFTHSFMDPGEIVSRYSPEILESNVGDFSSHNIHFVRFGLLPDQPSGEQ